MRLRRPPLTPLPPRRHVAPAPQPGYGVGYRPDWPSILSVAHDTADGGALFVVTDRPCALIPGPLALPLTVAGLSPLACVQVLPVKFRVTWSGAVPAGAAWTWGTGASSLIDPVSNHAPNPASGVCADTPGPYPPPPPAAPALVAAAYDADGGTVTLTFDRPVDVAGMDPAAVAVDDGSVMGFRYRGSGTPTRVDPVTVRVPLTGLDEYAGAGVTLSVAAGNGIVAVEGGTAWAGVADVSLPFP